MSNSSISSSYGTILFFATDATFTWLYVCDCLLHLCFLLHCHIDFYLVFYLGITILYKCYQWLSTYSVGNLWPLWFGSSCFSTVSWEHGLLSFHFTATLNPVGIITHSLTHHCSLCISFDTFLMNCNHLFAVIVDWYYVDFWNQTCNWQVVK